MSQPSPNRKKRALVIAGEASGDNYGSMLIKEIRRYSTDLEVWAVGGELIKEAGGTLISHYSEISVVGFSEVFGKLPKIIALMRRIKRYLRRREVDCVVLIDYPDFNFIVGKYAKRYDIPVIYYVPPQAWAWRKGRVRVIGGFADHVVVAFPFEVGFFKKFGVDVKYFGHPLVELMKKRGVPLGEVDARVPEMGRTLRIGIFPGSRDSEVTRLLPLQLEAARLIAERHEKIEFLISVAGESLMDKVKGIVKSTGVGVSGILMKDYSLFRDIDLAIASSGTVTLELALIGVPTVVIYKVSMLTYIIGKTLVNIDAIGLPNIVAGEKVFPELVQDEVTPVNIVEEIEIMMGNGELQEKTERLRGKLFEELDGVGPSKKIAEMVFEVGRC